MVTKHFFKTLIVFTFMIIVGLLSVFLVSYFGEAEGVNNSSLNTPVAK